MLVVYCVSLLTSSIQYLHCKSMNLLLPWLRYSDRNAVCFYPLLQKLGEASSAAASAPSAEEVSQNTLEVKDSNVFCLLALICYCNALLRLCFGACRVNCYSMKGELCFLVYLFVCFYNYYKTMNISL